MEDSMTRTLAVLGLVAAVFAHPAVAATPDITVRLDVGAVSGVPGRSATVRVFKGIPFAAPPVGPLRWKAPQPPSRWQGVRAADKFSAMCAQLERSGLTLGLPTSVGLGEPSEDCLYLNIWTTGTSSAQRRPVMVWIHGGGFANGSGKSLVFDGEELAKKGVVVVTINYRVGILGFFAHPELTKESERHVSGNYGLMDMVAALQWVQKNIAGFGGDPARVTIFGQSAGSAAVADLMASPLAKGLFHRAIGESSGPGLVPMRTLSAAEQDGLRLAGTLGARTLADLRALSMDALLKAGGSGGPIVDGWVLPADVATTFQQGKQNDAPVLIGSNSDEGAVLARPVAAEAYRKQAAQRFGELAGDYLKLYPGDSDEQAKTSQIVYSSDTMAWGMRNWARLQAHTGKSPVYLYYFTRRAPKDAAFQGAYHDAELYYAFHNLDLYKQSWEKWDRQLADILSTYWVNFATSGDPNGKDVPVWTPYDERRMDNVMNFGDTAKMGSGRLAQPKEKLLNAYAARQRQ
jgi:para-nitrobenzyl esterase